MYLSLHAVLLFLLGMVISMVECQVCADLGKSTRKPSWSELVQDDQVSGLEMLQLQALKVHDFDTSSQQSGDIDDFADLETFASADTWSCEGSSMNFTDMQRRIANEASYQVAQMNASTSQPEWLIVDKQLYRRNVGPDDFADIPGWGIGKKVGNGYQSKAKLEMMERLIRSVLRAACDEVADVAFNVDVSSDAAGDGIGGSEDYWSDLGPTLAIAHTLPKLPRNVVLVPNPYFTDVNSWGEKVRKSVSWESKAAKAFWRGGLQYRARRKCTDAGNQERIDAAKLSSNHGDDFDMKINSHNLKCASEDMLTHENVPFSDFAKYKYLVNIAGSLAGSYSYNINGLFAMGSAVLFWEREAGQGAPYKEWYMPALQDGVSHLNINKDNAQRIINNLKRDDATAKKLAAAACSVFKAAFTPCALTKHFVNVFNLLKSKQGVDPKQLLKHGGWVKVGGFSGSCKCQGPSVL